MSRDTQNWQRIEEMFHQLADTNEAEKQKVLDELRTADPDTYEMLKTLLEADEQPNGIFTHDPKELIDEWESDPDLLGQQIGAFRLESIVGQGAMGSVFRATRADGQFEQTVAIKLLKSHLSVASHRDLFDRERQILAKLNHPGIARLYDGGFTEDGRPYFTMEWIAGHSLTDYITQENCSLEKRLDLFSQVCDAVRYAHQSLIAHLDLKPANIIVNEDGQVKLLDFGVSRLMEDTLDNTGSFTLAYAAPEQITRESANAVSDIYSLGIILREILTHKHPFASSFSKPQKLKERILAGTPDQLPEPQTNFPKDINMISRKAMAINPADRYGSVDELVSDLNAYKSEYPVSMRRQDWQYVAGRYFRRHRKVLTATAVALILLLSTGAFYTIQLQEQRNIAQTEAKKASQITGLLTEVFMAADPNIGGADTLTAVNLLDQGALKLKESLKDDPEMQADMQLRLADIYNNLGRYDKGMALSEDAVALLTNHPGSSQELLAWGEAQVGVSLYYTGQLDSAVAYILRGLDRLRENRIQSDLEVDMQVELANAYFDQGLLVQADSLYRMCNAEYERTLEAPDVDLAFTLHMIGATARDLGNLEESEEYLLRSLAMKKEMFEEPHLEIAYSYNYLGSLNQTKGNLEAALEYVTMSYKQRRAILGDYHVETMASLANTARTYTRMGRYEEAVDIYSQCLDVVDSLFGKTHYYYAGLIGSQATAYMELGEYDKAKNAFLESLGLYKELNPTNVLRQIPAMIKLGEIAEQQNNLSEARALYEEALEMRENALPAGHYQIAQSQQILGGYLLRLGDFSAAIKYLELALDSFESDPDTDPATITSINTSLAEAYSGINDEEKAGYYQERLTASE